MSVGQKNLPKMLELSPWFFIERLAFENVSIQV